MLFCGVLKSLSLEKRLLSSLPSFLSPSKREWSSSFHLPLGEFDQTNTKGQFLAFTMAPTTSPSSSKPEISMFKGEGLSAILFYSLCSCSLLLINKVVLLRIPCVPLVSSLQFFWTLTVIGCFHKFQITKIGPISPGLLKKYGIYSLLFAARCYANMKSLKVLNVDTVIVIRSLGPLLVAFFEFLFLGRALPTLSSLFALISVVLGSFWFLHFDSGTVNSYSWAFIYLFFISSDVVFSKFILSGTESINLTTKVFVNNSYALLSTLFLGLVTSEFSNFDFSILFEPIPALLLFGSCMITLGIGYSSWWARTILTATGFITVGVLNKIATVLANYFMWDNHSSPIGMVGLFVCLVGGSFYQQAPLRKEKGN